jgi:DNA-binding response OmpR family regulator
MKVKAKVLIVDDEQINLDFFDVMLSKLGFLVEKAEDGEEALEKVRSFKPDVIILDNIMPKISGWEVTRILKQNEEFREFRSIPIIMFSAMDDVKDKIEGFELGVEDYITKPFNFSEVLARIKAVLRHKDFTDQMLQREKRIALLESVNLLLTSMIDDVRRPLESLLKELDTIHTEDPDQMRQMLHKVKEQCLQLHRKFEDLNGRVRELQGHESDLRKQEVSLKELEERYQRTFGALKGSGKG